MNLRIPEPEFGKIKIALCKENEAKILRAALQSLLYGDKALATGILETIKKILKMTLDLRISRLSRDPGLAYISTLTHLMRAMD